MTGATLLALSRTGELAVMLDARPTYATFSTGTLGRVALEGGSPREIVSSIENADWSPDGTTLAIVRQAEGREALESPPGKVIYENGGAIGHPRFSPQGDRIAFFEHPGHGTDNGSVAVVDLSGNKTILSTQWTDLTGLAWSPKGDEIWFSGARDNGSGRIFAVTRGGVDRGVISFPSDMVLYDIAPDGKILLAGEDWRGGIYALTPGHSQETDLSLFDFSIASDLSADGKTLTFFESGEAGGPLSSSFLRKTDGTAAVRLADGFCGALSHDSKPVICTPEGQLNEVPTGTGEIKRLTHDNLIHSQIVHWFPDEKRILFTAQEPGHGVRYVQDLANGQPRSITPEGASLS
jgi:Tol biopolymer transport system component